MEKSAAFEAGIADGMSKTSGKMGDAAKFLGEGFQNLRGLASQEGRDIYRGLKAGGRKDVELAKRIRNTALAAGGVTAAGLGAAGAGATMAMRKKDG